MHFDTMKRDTIHWGYSSTKSMKTFSGCLVALLQAAGLRRRPNAPTGPPGPPPRLGAPGARASAARDAHGGGQRTPRSVLVPPEPGPPSPRREPASAFRHRYPRGLAAPVEKMERTGKEEAEGAPRAAAVAERGPRGLRPPRAASPLGRLFGGAAPRRPTSRRAQDGAGGRPAAAPWAPPFCEAPRSAAVCVMVEESGPLQGIPGADGYARGRAQVPRAGNPHGPAARPPASRRPGKGPPARPGLPAPAARPQPGRGPRPSPGLRDTHWSSGVRHLLATPYSDPGSRRDKLSLGNKSVSSSERRQQPAPPPYITPPAPSPPGGCSRRGAPLGEPAGLRAP
ncbi:collagen alpha-1(I) chain-like [Meriones unguiculatus]|uniref:collagen alpha-1(I) chain-like n=1 Tax=Meriones unguiculatus TaxID=10047 RepID=UPI00293E4EA3|nr:collagen alpha-1(I) chain-like [Meriones unguiculatus]